MRCVVSFLLIEDMVVSSKDAEKFVAKSQHRAVDRDTMFHEAGRKGT